MRLIWFLAILAIAVFGNLQAATIHEVIDQGDSAAVAAMLDANPALLGDRLPNGRTPLHTAAYGGKLNIVELLLSRGANPDDTTIAGSVSLHGAAINGHEAVVKLLVEKGANVNKTNQGGFTPLTNASIGGNVQMMKCLADAGASIDAKTDAEQVPLFQAAINLRAEGVEFLLEAGAKPNIASPQGEPLIMAATANALWMPDSTGPMRIFRSLLSHGANPDFAPLNGYTALMVAAREAGDSIVLKLLLDNGANPDAVADNGATPFGEAVEFGNFNSAKYLIGKGANPNSVESITGSTPLHFAVRRGESPLVELVFPVTVDPNKADSAGMTPLDIALQCGYTKIAEYLREGGAKALAKKHIPSSAHFSRKPAEGEAYLWYLDNCGYLIRTRQHCLIFDYWTDEARPDEPSLSSGFINPSEIASEDVIVFVSHEHYDHFDSTIFGWPGKIPKLQYVFGFRPDSLEERARQGYSGQPYEYVGPGMSKEIDGMQVMAVRSNDAGVGFVVNVDGLTIYHAGDLAGWLPDQREGFTSQIDSIDAAFDSVDIALINVTGCHHQDTVALAEGTAYTFEKLNPKLAVPTHGRGRELYYAQFMAKFKDQFPDLASFCPKGRGDAAKFTIGRKPDRLEVF